MKDEPDNIEDFTREYLRRIDKRLDAFDQRLDKLEHVTGRIDIRLKTVEAHMTGFLSSARYLENEIDVLRGRVEALEQQLFQPPANP